MHRWRVKREKVVEEMMQSQRGRDGAQAARAYRLQAKQKTQQKGKKVKGKKVMTFVLVHDALRYVKGGTYRDCPHLWVLRNATFIFPSGPARRVVHGARGKQQLHSRPQATLLHTPLACKVRGLQGTVLGCAF